MTMMDPLSFFQWGAGGKAMTPDELQKMRLLEAQRAMQGDTRPADTPAQGLARVAEALAGSFRRGQLDQQAEELAAHDQSRIASWGNTLGAGSGAAVPAPDVAASLMAQPANVSTGSTYEPFMQTVQQGVNNPYALAAIAATGQAESGFSPANANRTWSDPSQSGQPGTAGGIMSWRNDRLNNLMSYAAQAGEQPGAVSPQTQAQFFMQENPQLINQLNNARSVEEAQGLMNNAWRFAGYNQPGGEADRRLQVARALLPQFQGGQSGREAQSPAQAQSGYNSQALLDTSVDPRVSEQTRSVAQALLKQQQARDAAALQLQQRQAAAQSAGIDPRFAADDELWKQAAAAQFRQPPQAPTSVQEYEYYRSQAGQNALPYDQWDQARRRSGAQQTTINTGEGDRFYGELDKGQAAMFNDLMNQGNQARRALVQIDRLDDLLADVPTGAAASWKQFAGNYGIDTNGLSDIQALQALINQMVPQQRPAGSGPMSDADLELFKQSLPRLINTPEGNRFIVNTLRGIAQYDLGQGDIAARVANREISPAEGRRLLNELSNPLAGLRDQERARREGGKASGTLPGGIKWSVK